MERVNTLHIGVPNEKQKLFLQCRAKYIAFGGAGGGGKSWAVRTKAKLIDVYKRQDYRFCGILGDK